MNISLPRTLKDWVDEQVSRRGFGTASKFVGQVLRDEKQRQLRERIDAALIGGIDSGPSTPMTAKDWENIRRQGRRRLARRKKAK